MNEAQTNILVVDDEEDLCEILQFNLESEGYHVDTVNSAEEALTLPLQNYHLILLDVMMGGMSGFRFAEKIKRDIGLKTPIIFLTARDTENDLITGFNIGADDYISKPFSVNELSVRIKAVIRRTQEIDEVREQDIEQNGMILDQKKKIFRVDDDEILLTRKEFEILSLLMKSPGRIYTREDILYRIWQDDVIVNDRTVDVHFARLRKKLGIHGACLKNKTGHGYYFDA